MLKSKSKLTKLVEDKAEIIEKINTTTDLQKGLEKKITLIQYKPKKKSKIYEAYDKFLINKCGAEYEKYYGNYEREFMDFYYGEKYKSALEKMQLYEVAYDEDCSSTIGLTCFVEPCYCKRYCCICKDIIPRGGGGGYYTVVDNDTCNEKCRDTLIQKFKEHGIFIPEFCIAWPAYGD